MKIALLTTDGAKFIESLAEGIGNNEIDADVSLVITNKPNSRAIGVSAMYGIDCEVIDHRYFNDREEHDKSIMEKLDRAGVDLVICADYKRLIKNKEFLDKYSGGLINVHFSLLPEYPGMYPHITAFKENARKSGYTIHFIDDSLDGGKIVFQEGVDISDCLNAEQIYDKILLKACKGLKSVINDFSIRALLMNAKGN